MTGELLNWLFIDLNSYFASVEQELQPELRGQPIAIVPIDAVCDGPGALHLTGSKPVSTH